jgi:M6 family metalloprotease-like protein
MHLNFEIADVYNSGMTAKTMSSIEVDEQNYFYFTQLVVEDVIDDYKSKNGNSSTKQFDSDSDGFIDAVWMIYSCPNYSNNKTLSDEYWAYVYWNNWNETASYSSPVAGAYGWASYDFMYEMGTSKIDAHTYIHETGHLFGLDDYYNYDEGRTSLGGVDMMDYNVIDHNSWSKMALGWTKPYIVTGNAEITISAAVDSGDCILIPDVTSGWNGTSFDEFILLELYSPTGLNAKDATTSYNSAKVYTEPGIRLYHVDSRLCRYTYSSSYGWQFSTYIEPSGFITGSYYYYCTAASNTPSYSENEDYELIHMIQAGGTDTFSYGGAANNSDLFKTGQTFSMSTYGSKFFANGTKFNNGNDFGYTITFVSVSSTSATIRITKA